MSNVQASRPVASGGLEKRNAISFEAVKQESAANAPKRREWDSGACMASAPDKTPQAGASDLQKIMRSAPASGSNGSVGAQLRALSDILENIRTILNSIAELYLPGGGAADPAASTTDAGQPLRRILPSAFSDGRSAPSGTERPNAREISNAVSSTTGDKENKAGASDLFWLFGQFLDHDLDLTLTGDTEFPVSVPKGDATFDKNATDEAELDMKRSQAVKNIFGVDQQLNSITALIDGSNIYGSDEARTNELRSFEGGKMRLSADGSLPTDMRGFYEAGDIRVNENIGLTSMHTLFTREHNRIAEQLSSDNPSMNDQQIFDAARAKVTAQLQAITVNEFLPVLLGADAMGAYSGPVQGLDAQVSNSFSAAAYRFGHSMVSDTITPLGEDGQPVGEPIALKDAFFNPEKFSEVGMDAILRGFAANTAQAVDPEIVDSLRNFVLDNPGGPRLDLASLNIQRGRDHGLPTLNDARRAFGLQEITSFDDPAFREGVGARLASIYESPEDIDLWVGLLSEEPAGSELVGPTQKIILQDQFLRLRDGDPNWYQNVFSGDELAEINSTSLADIIERNTGAQVQDNALIAPQASIPLA